jgi:glycosyltransferase involved in cell wall biosynthesis
MKFCMLTSFFGPHSFGGDAVYVDRLSRALLRRGHEVTVIYSLDAYEAVRGRVEPAPYEAPAGLRINAVRSVAQPFPLLLSHQLGRPVGMKRDLLAAMGGEHFDVLHFHNISLLGGPGVLALKAPGNPLRVMTAHEFWLVCERSVLWKNGSETCEAPACVSCSLNAGRPPQWWRRLGAWQRDLDALDLLLTPSETSMRIHAERGLDSRMQALPYFVGPEWLAEKPAASQSAYFLFAGRLVREKGVAKAIAAMEAFPRVELRIAGQGPDEAALRAHAPKNVRFLGRLDEASLREAYRGAIATLIPSEMVETFGYVALESMATGTPVIASDIGALPELVRQSGGGVVFKTPSEMRAAMHSLIDEPVLRARLGAQGKASAQRLWNEERHIEEYLGLLKSAH